jgi:hypothetical protein
MKTHIFTCLIFIACAFFLTACNGGHHANGAKIAAGANTPATAPTEPSDQASKSKEQSPYVTEVKALGEFTDGYGFLRKYVQIAPGLSDAQLIDLARRLHALEPKTWFWMLDDGAQAKQMMEALPRTAEGDFSGYPRKWVEQHTSAHIVMEIVPRRGRRWVLAKGSGGDVMATLSSTER